MKTKIAILVLPRHFEIIEEEISPRSTEVLIKLASCGLCNYELNHWEGLMGTPPLRLGHEGAGTIVEIGSEVTKYKVGDKVTGLIFNGFAEYAVADQNDIYKLNNEIDAKYSFNEPLKCVTTVLRSTKPEAGDFGVVAGCGPMGLWSIQGLKGNMLSALIAVDVNDKHLEFAKKYGATHVINPLKQDVVSSIEKITNGNMADFVIEGTGNEKVVNDCMNYLCKFGRLVIMSSFKKPAEMFDLRLAVKKGVRMIVAHGSLTQEDDWRRSTYLINKGVYQTKDIITHEFKLSQINEAFNCLENKPNGYLKGIISFD